MPVPAVLPRRAIGIPRLRAISAVHCGQLWLLSLRFSKRRCHCPDSTIPSRMEFTRMPFSTSSFDRGQRHIEQRGTGSRGGNHVLFRLQSQQRVHTGNRGDIRLFKLRLEGLYRVNHAEQFQFGFVQPGLARRIGEVGDIAPARRY